MFRLLMLLAGLCGFQCCSIAQDDVSVHPPQNSTLEEPEPTDPEDVLKQIFKPIYKPEFELLEEDPVLYIDYIMVGVGIGGGIGVVLVDQGWVEDVSIPEIKVWDHKWRQHEFELSVDADYEFAENPFDWNDNGVIVRPEIDWIHTMDDKDLEAFIRVPIQVDPSPVDPILQIGVEINY